MGIKLSLDDLHLEMVKKMTDHYLKPYGKKTGNVSNQWVRVETSAYGAGFTSESTDLWTIVICFIPAEMGLPVVMIDPSRPESIVDFLYEQFNQTPEDEEEGKKLPNKHEEASTNFMDDRGVGVESVC